MAQTPAPWMEQAHVPLVRVGGEQLTFTFIDIGPDGQPDYEHPTVAEIEEPPAKDE